MTKVTDQLRCALMICQDVRPGNRPSQNVEPLTGLPVIGERWRANT
ncbi:MAG: hypothetical protein ACKVP2_00990 [Burkholderiales bacterium]